MTSRGVASSIGTDPSEAGVAPAPHPISAPGIMEVVIGLLTESGSLRGKLLVDVPAGQGAFAAELIRRQLGVEVRCGDICPGDFTYTGVACEYVDLNKTLPYPSGSVDIFTCIEGIEHIENPFHLVREASRILRPGGGVVITTPNVLSLRSRWQYLLYGAANTFDYMAGTPWHINPVSYIELRFILEREGFALRRVTTNAMTKRHSWWHRFLKRVVATRGRSWVRGNATAAAVRDMLLSETLLFGDCLIVHAVKR